MSDLKDLQARCFDWEVKTNFVDLKSEWVGKLLPAKRVIDAGGMWGCNGYYSFVAAKGGADEVVLLDGNISEKFRDVNAAIPNVKWVHIDFYHSLFDGKLKQLGEERPADGLILYDVMLHQPDPMLCLHKLAKSFSVKRAVIANPVKKDSTKSADLTFIPHNDEFSPEKNQIGRSENIDDRTGWVWLMSHGFVRNCCKYLGFKIVEESVVKKWEGNTRLDYSIFLIERV